MTVIFPVLEKSYYAPCKDKKTVKNLTNTPPVLVSIGTNRLGLITPLVPLCPASHLQENVSKHGPRIKKVGDPDYISPSPRLTFQSYAIYEGKS